MKKFTKTFLALILAVVGWGTANAAEKTLDLTFSTAEYCAAKWTAGTSTFQWGSGGWNSAWTFMAVNELKGDISKFQKLHFKLTDFTNSENNSLTIYFKGNIGNTQSMDHVTSAILTPNADGIAELDLTTMDWTNDNNPKETIEKTNIADVTIYGGARTDATTDASVKVTEAWAIQEVPATEAGAETVIYSYDYSAEKQYTFNSMGCSTIGYDADKNALVITNADDSGNAWDIQPHIANGYTIQNGYDYKIRFTMKANDGGTVRLRVGTWDFEINPNIVFTKCSDYQTFTTTFKSNKNASGCFVAWQGKKFVGEVDIKKIEVLEITPDTPPAPKFWYTILEDDCSSANNFCVKYFKNYVAATAIDGSIVAQSLDPEKEYTQYYSGSADPAKVANDWDTQFFIKLPVALPSGTKVRFSMRYKADEAATGQPQSHGFPEAGKVEGQESYGGTYINSNLFGNGVNVSFQENWGTYYKEFEAVSNDKMDMQSICFNLEVLREVNNYYFDDIIVAAEITDELAEDIANAKKGIAIPLTVKEAGYATFAPAMDVKVPEGVTAYTAKLADSKKSVALTPITEIPAGTPVVIAAAQGDYSFEVLTQAAAVSNNDLAVSDGTATGEGIYVLAKNESVVGFYKLASGDKVPAGKAYLKIAGGSSREFFAIAGDATAIKTVETAKADGAIYNLAGQQVKRAQKGIYIINGKKAIVK